MRLQRRLAGDEFEKIRGFPMAASLYVEFLGILSFGKSTYVFSNAQLGAYSHNPLGDGAVMPPSLHGSTAGLLQTHNFSKLSLACGHHVIEEAAR